MSGRPAGRFVPTGRPLDILSASVVSLLTVPFAILDRYHGGGPAGGRGRVEPIRKAPRP